MKLSKYFPDSAVITQTEAADWREAIELSGAGLVDQGATTAQYTAEMITALEDLGPYIVIAPGFALAHSRPSPAVLRTAMSFVSLKRGVEFGSDLNDPVDLVIGLAATDQDSHLEVMSALARILSDTEVMAKLREASSAQQVRVILDSAAAE